MSGSEVKQELRKLIIKSFHTQTAKHLLIQISEMSEEEAHIRLGELQELQPSLLLLNARAKNSLTTGRQRALTK